MALMRQWVQILVVGTVATVAARPALADSMQLSFSGSALVDISSPNDNFWGTYSSSNPTYLDDPTLGFEQVHVVFSSASLFLPAGSVIDHASLSFVPFSSEITGTGQVFVEHALPPPVYPGPSTAPVLNPGGSSWAFEQAIDEGLPTPLPIINGNEVSTGDLDMLFSLSGGIDGSVATAGQNWNGYIGGNGQVDLPYTVDLNVDYSVAPEPASLLLAGTGVLLAVWVGGRRRAMGRSCP